MAKELILRTKVVLILLDHLLEDHLISHMAMLTLLMLKNNLEWIILLLMLVKAPNLFLDHGRRGLNVCLNLLSLRRITDRSELST